MKVTEFVGHVRGMLGSVEPAEAKIARLGAFLDGVESSVQMGAVDGNARVGRVVRSRSRPMVATGSRRKRADGHDPRIPPVGSVIRRGEHEVKVLPNGLIGYDGKEFKSLSGPAAAIRNGQATSGFEYFRLFRLPGEFSGEEEPCVIVDGEIKSGGQPLGARHEVAGASGTGSNGHPGSNGHGANGNGHGHESGGYPPRLVAVTGGAEDGDAGQDESGESSSEDGGSGDGGDEENAADGGEAGAADGETGETGETRDDEGDDDASDDDGSSDEGEQAEDSVGEQTEEDTVAESEPEVATTAAVKKSSKGGKAKPKSKKGGKKGKPKAKAKPKAKKKGR